MGKPIAPEVLRRGELLARSHSLMVVAELLRLSRGTVYRLAGRGWEVRDYSCMRRPVPSDFAIQAKGMTHAQIKAHYGASTLTVSRWMREAKPRPPLKPPGYTREQRALRAASQPLPAEPAPAPVLCSVCARTLESLDTACARTDCPLRPRRK